MVETTGGMTWDELLAAWPILSVAERLEAFSHFSDHEADEFFERLDADDQAEMLARFDPARQRRLLELLAPDDLTDVFQELDERRRGDVFKTLSAEALAEVEQLASYDEDDAGGLMTPDFAHVQPDMTVDRAIVSLRLQLRERPETLRYLYVLDPSRRLVGIVSLRDLFGATPQALVGDLMKTDLVTVREDTDQEEVAHLMQHLSVSALPVLDGAGQIKGIVTSDDVIAVMEEEATEDIHKLAAVSPTEIDYLRASVGHLWRRRIGWLMILLVTGFLTMAVLDHYETTLQSAVILAVFIPILIGAGGNTATQSATLVIRSLSTADLRARDWGHIFVKELAVGMLLGLVLAVALGLPGYIMGRGDLRVVLILGLTMVAVIVWANLVGAILPVVVRAARLDPAVVSAPLVSTLVDATGLLIYFNIARLILAA